MNHSPTFNLISITIIYVSPSIITTRLHITIHDTATVREALISSHFFDHHPELSLETLAVGIYGERVFLDRSLQQHDRIEIYLPLIMDPKTRRRLKHEEKKQRSQKTTR